MSEVIFFEEIFFVHVRGNFFDTKYLKVSKYLKQTSNSIVTVSVSPLAQTTHPYKDNLSCSHRFLIPEMKMSSTRIHMKMIVRKQLGRCAVPTFNLRTCLAEKFVRVGSQFPIAQLLLFRHLKARSADRNRN